MFKYSYLKCFIALSDFSVLKTVVSSWYDSNRCLPMLRVLFRDKVDNQELSKVTDTMDLLNILFQRGHLSSQNSELLCDTISITKHLGILSNIKEKLPSFPNVEEGNISKTFTPHRQKLMKFGMELTTANVTQIDGLYNTPCKRYADSWEMISDLEDRQIISKGNMKAFTDSLTILNPTGGVNITEALSDFSVLKAVVSSWYDSNRCLPMLRVLFRDKVDNQELSKVTDTMDLLNILFARGHLGLQNSGLLCDTISITKHLGLFSKIKEKLPSFPNVEEGNISKTFTSHRQKIMKFGMELTIASVTQIDGLYNTPCKRYADSWEMISDLEERQIISKGNMKAFTDSLTILNPTGGVNITEALSDFSVLKAVVSSWYDSNRCLPMLKVLFRDKVENVKLSKVTGTMDLLNILFARGYLSLQNSGLLCDTISITKHLGLLSKIKEKLPSFPDVEEGTISTKFTPHRQKLMKFGMVLTLADVTQIDGLRNMPCKEYADSWEMISDLEDKHVISEEKMEEFIDSLKTLNIPLAVNALT
ncbi:uncharacterized protein LOC117112963 [Anneissia japonica]|uniref:uncharacterized protein LOC117112963 n=1 Tax=Anneissia japonica TaxID=1529436 RepID=UPI0014255258|nr:uncharacterized protein LOC117112963 [Anneissia japonica]